MSIAKEQGQVLLDDAGFSVAQAVRDGKAKPFEKRSVNLSDGADGKQGGVAILRYGDEALTLVFKYAAQGLSHGHYDKLSFSLYEQGDEVLQDYGLVRFVNVEQKGGGNYLKENATWAKQSIAHNTLIQNETSHFEGRYEIGSQHHSDLYFYDDTNSDVQVVSATEFNAYPGTELRRTMAIVKNERFEKPFLMDILKVRSDKQNMYDLPFYYLGQVLQTSFDYETPPSLRTLGDSDGYQHLHLEAKGKPGSDSIQFSWLNNFKFYTLTSATTAADQLLFTRLGANDPEFNLRRDPAFMIRRNAVGNTVFATTIEPHGSYSPVSELATDSNGSIAALTVAYDDDDYTAISIKELDGHTSLFLLSNEDASSSRKHRLKIDGKVFRWSGPYSYIDLN